MGIQFRMASDSNSFKNTLLSIAVIEFRALICNVCTFSPIQCSPNTCSLRACLFVHSRSPSYSKLSAICHPPTGAMHHPHSSHPELRLNARWANAIWTERMRLRAGDWLTDWLCGWLRACTASTSSACVSVVTNWTAVDRRRHGSASHTANNNMRAKPRARYAECAPNWLTTHTYTQYRMGA